MLSLPTSVGFHDLSGVSSHLSPPSGRSYHVLAVASKDLRMITLKPVPEAGKDSGAGGSRFDIKQAGQFDEHGSSVWRVCWNITGTILASSGDDGCVKLWKANYLDNWACVSTLRADGQVRETGGRGWRLDNNPPHCRCRPPCCDTASPTTSPHSARPASPSSVWGWGTRLTGINWLCRGLH